MIAAVIFDLDGTLIKSERLKAHSYHQAIQELGRSDVSLDQVTEVYQKVIGQTRHVISSQIMDAFGLEKLCLPLMAQYGADKPAGVLTAMRLRIYDKLVADDSTLRENQWPYAVDLVNAAHSNGCRIGLATSSLTAEAVRVLKALDLTDTFEAVVGLDQVTRGKPDPEVYLTAAARLGVDPEHCLVIEDSPPGVAAGLAAGMNVIGVANPFTLLGLHESQLSHDWIVHDPDQLASTVERRIREHNAASHPATDSTSPGQP